MVCYGMLAVLEQQPGQQTVWGHAVSLFRISTFSLQIASK